MSGGGLFWAARMAGFGGWGTWYVDLDEVGGPTAIPHVWAALAFAADHGIMGQA